MIVRMNENPTNKQQLLKIALMSEMFHVRPTEFILPDGSGILRLAIDNVMVDLLEEHYARKSDHINT